MKWLIVLVLLLILAALAFIRFRKQLQTAWFMWRTFRQFRNRTKPQQKQVEVKEPAKNETLVRCPKCNKWVAQDDAVKLKSNYYCSLQCLEESISVKV